MSDDGRVDLADFLLARLAEDEAEARAAAAGPWTYGDIESVAGGSLYDPDVMIASIHWDNVGTNPEPIHRFRSKQQADATGRHIARWNPARALAECEAKRVVISLCQTPDPHTAEEAGDGCTECAVLYTMAAVYRDHPDYDESWRP